MGGGERDLREEERLHLEVVLPAFVHEGPVLQGAIVPLAVLHADVPGHPNDKEAAIDSSKGIAATRVF